MTVKTILDRKGSDVATIEPTADLASAVKLLAARRIRTGDRGHHLGTGHHTCIGRVRRRSARAAGWTGDDPQSSHLHSRGHNEQHYGADDRRQVPALAGRGGK